jgi:CRP/FNR family transcriptional regulator, cyclic AMP receptor protein
MTVRDQLATIDLFADLPAPVLDDLVARGTRFKAGAGKVLVRQGNTDSGLQLVLAGTATILVNDVEVGTMTAGQHFGEMSLFDGAPRSATLIAGSDGVETFALSALAFSDLLQDHPEVVRPIMRVLVGRIRRLEGSAVTDR